MTEAWMHELLITARDQARAQGLPRLAEHLDDALLLAASEYSAATRGSERDDDAEAGPAVRGDARRGLH